MTAIRETTKPIASKPKGIKGRGFASMDPERRRKICSRGGKAAHANGVAHRWTSEEAKIAGMKGAIRRAEK